MDQRRRDSIASLLERIDADYELREELALCAERNLPHSRFLSWDVADQDKALAFRRFERSLCPRCGSRDDHWLNEEGKLLEVPKLKPRLERCYGCLEVEAVREDIPPDDRSSVTVRLVPNPAARE